MYRSTASLKSSGVGRKPEQLSADFFLAPVSQWSKLAPQSTNSTLFLGYGVGPSKQSRGKPELLWVRSSQTWELELLRLPLLQRQCCFSSHSSGGWGWWQHYPGLYNRKALLWPLQVRSRRGQTDLGCTYIIWISDFRGNSRCSCGSWWLKLSGNEGYWIWGLRSWEVKVLD